MPYNIPGGAFDVTVTMVYYMYMLGAKRRFGQSTDCPAQSMDLRFARQSTDCPLNPWIARIKGLKAWIWSNHGFELEDTCMPNDPSLLQYHAWI